ncbi:hypothetical protein EDC45_0359 [Mesocricetibacter intestinalis]|uniref:Uncharacterized protein n=1 Tax=Mesocricetibacter intestinalis TaxID=1521930 RepID=A0A4R6VFY7_9PAST|nr:hypothetical protein [Mesocricetibacter intestinalis]TDQ59701.1 hypothetical protein EDC45_0359 [Mesocricetibacter intestinalis]
MKDYKKLLSIFCLSALLAACSGGGGGGNKPPQQTPPGGPMPERPQPPKPDIPPAKPEYFTETVNKDGKNKDSRWNSTQNITKDAIPVYEISRIKDRKGRIILDHKQEIIAKAKDRGRFNSYKFDLLGQEGFYGYYFNTHRGQIFVNYAYGFDKSLENKNVPADMTATYSKQGGFVYTLDYPEIGKNLRDSSVSKADVNIQFQKGNIVKGEILDPSSKEQLFKIEKGNSINQLVFTPTDPSAFGSLTKDKGIADVNYLNSAKDKNDHKYLVGTVKANNWYGVLAAEKQ